MVRWYRNKKWETAPGSTAPVRMANSIGPDFVRQGELVASDRSLGCAQPPSPARGEGEIYSFGQVSSCRFNAIEFVAGAQ